MKWLVMIWLWGGGVVIDRPPEQTAESCVAYAEAVVDGRMAVAVVDGRLWVVEGAVCLEREEEVAER